MKRFLVFFILILCINSPAFAVDEVDLEFDRDFQKHSLNIVSTEELAAKSKEDLSESVDDEPKDVEDIDILNSPLPEIVVTEETAPLTFYSKIQKEITKTMKDIYKLPIEDTETITPLFKERLTAHYAKGPISSLYTRAIVQSNFDLFMPQDGDEYGKFNVNLVNVLFDAKTRSGKDMFRVMIDPSHQHNLSFMQNFFKDLFIETKRIPHHSILIGNSRVGTGLEGLQSAYTLPFMFRSQISRNFSNVRKIGVRVRGDYKYVDYDFGGYSSDTFFTDFMPGGEFNSWVEVKPFAKTKGKYGDLRTGTGISAGKRNSTGYVVGGVGLKYSYKKMWTQMEYSVANGSNGATGLSSKHRQGWYVTLGCKLTKKLEFLARYDEFDPDKSVGHNNRKEYTTGINYYIKGQALKLVLNYIYCHNKGLSNSHRFMVGAQIAI